MSVSLPDPVSHPDLFDGVLLRRMLAYVIDLVIMAAVLALLAIFVAVAGFFTFGLAWALLPIAVPLVIIAYYALTLGSPARATVGMQLLDLVLTPARGMPLDGWTILIHPLLFWVTAWISWPVSLAIALFTPRQQMVHDLACGTLMLRRSPMARHWARLRSA